MIHVLDQRVLPGRERLLRLRTLDQVIQAIRTMAVRGAPLIGVCAGYGMVLAARRARTLGELVRSARRLRSARPTAVNLRWAVDRILRILTPVFDSLRPAERVRVTLQEARAIHREDEQLCERIAEHGARLVPRNAGILTICNTGALATGGIGTAFGVFVRARSKSPTIYALETRPRLQGARLTMYEIAKARLRGVLVCDGAAGALLRDGRIDLVLTGADCIAANGDTANKLGTYSLALLARAHKVPFYVAAPCTTFDPSAGTGRDIPIEERDPGEILRPLGLARRRIRTLNPAFDVTPARYINAFVTDRGILRPPYRQAIRRRMLLPQNP